MLLRVFYLECQLIIFEQLHQALDLFLEDITNRDIGSIIKVGAHRLRGTLTGFLEVRLGTFSFWG